LKNRIPSQDELGLVYEVINNSKNSNML